MHHDLLEKIVAELAESLSGHFVGRVFQLSSTSVALDFGIRERGYLFIDVEPAAPRLYLIKRTLRQLEKQSIPLAPFAQALRTKLSGARLVELAKAADDRVIRLSLAVADPFGQPNTQVLVAQLTGRSANLLLLDSAGTIEYAWRNLDGQGQRPGDFYVPPQAERGGQPSKELPFEIDGATTISEAADRYYNELATAGEFDELAAELRASLRKETGRLKRLRKNLTQDLIEHGDPAAHKRMGDLLLANVTNAKRAGSKVQVTDYYAEGTPAIEVEIDEKVTLQEAAAEFFLRYGKAKRAVGEIGERLKQVERELTKVEARREELEKAISAHDLSALPGVDLRKTKAGKEKPKRKEAQAIPGVRRYRSSDGYEVLVGKAARDNDHLTFRVARPHDIWLHAGDYPGSHVVIRNSSKADIPHRTIIEAAQLAAKFSQAGKDSKVTIHYTQRKFLTKPKGAAPGLVRMSSFKSLTVEPGEYIEREK